MSKDFPTRSKQHISDDKGVAIFNYVIADYFASRSIEHNDYGIDCLVDLAESDEEILGGEVLKGKCFCAQLKSSNKNKNSYSIRRKTFMYWYRHQLPVFLVHVNWETQLIKFVNVREQLRRNYYVIKDTSIDKFKFNLRDTTKLNYCHIDNLEKNELQQKQSDLSQTLYAEVRHELFRSLYENELINMFSNLEQKFESWGLTLNRDFFLEVDCSEPEMQSYFQSYNALFYISLYFELEDFVKLRSLEYYYKQRQKNKPKEMDYIAEVDRTNAYFSLFEAFFSIHKILKPTILAESDYWEYKNAEILLVFKEESLTSFLSMEFYEYKKNFFDKCDAVVYDDILSV